MEKRSVAYWLGPTLRRETCNTPLPHHRLSAYCKHTKGLDSGNEKLELSSQHSHPPTSSMFDCSLVFQWLTLLWSETATSSSPSSLLHHHTDMCDEQQHAEDSTNHLVLMKHLN